MKGELVQVGRCRQLLQDRHLLERKEEEERLRSKVAEVRMSFDEVFFFRSGQKQNSLCVEEASL